MPQRYSITQLVLPWFLFFAGTSTCIASGDVTVVRSVEMQAAGSEPIQALYAFETTAGGSAARVVLVDRGVCMVATDRIIYQPARMLLNVDFPKTGWSCSVSLEYPDIPSVDSLEDFGEKIETNDLYRGTVTSGESKAISFEGVEPSRDNLIGDIVSAVRARSGVEDALAGLDRTELDLIKALESAVRRLQPSQVGRETLGGVGEACSSLVTVLDGNRLEPPTVRVVGETTYGRPLAEGLRVEGWWSGNDLEGLCGLSMGDPLWDAHPDELAGRKGVQ